MPEPTSSSTAAVIAAWLSATTLALVGVDYYALLWGLIGAAVSLSQSGRMGRVRAVVYVALSTLVGAALGHGAQWLLESTARPLLIVGSLIGGAGAQLLVAVSIQAVEHRIKHLGGMPGTTGDKS